MCKRIANSGSVIMKKVGLIGLMALGLVGLTAPASAYVITINSVVQRSGAYPGDLFPLAALPNGPANSFISSAPGSVSGINYSFTGGSQGTSGIYTGNGSIPAGSNQTASPYTDANTTREFFSAEGGAGKAFLSYGSNNTSLSLLWGTVDAGSTRNLITTSAGETINGGQILAAAGCGACVDGQTEVFVTITGLAGFGSLTFSDADANAFEFNIKAVPELSTWGMMILGFLGLGFLGYRKSSNASRSAFRMA
jgi:hypothetical protein